MTARFQMDPTKYRRLLSRVLPVVIETDEENERLLKEIERLMDKGEGNLSPEEDRLFDLMTKLVRDYERDRYPIPDVPPDRFLRYLIEQRGLKQADLIPIFGTSGRVSDVVKGKRSISKAQAKALGEFFNMSLLLFFRR